MIRYKDNFGFERVFDAALADLPSGWVLLQPGQAATRIVTERDIQAIHASDLQLQIKSYPARIGVRGDGSLGSWLDPAAFVDVPSTQAAQQQAAAAYQQAHPKPEAPTAPAPLAGNATDTQKIAFAQAVSDYAQAQSAHESAFAAWMQGLQSAVQAVPLVMAWPEDSVEINGPLPACPPGHVLLVDDGEVVARELPQPQIEGLRATKIEQIKALRDQRRFDGGVKVVVDGREHWVSSSLDSITHYTAMAAEAMMLSLPQNAVMLPDWRTKAYPPTTVPMTPALVAQIIQAGMLQVAQTDAAAQTHIAAVQALTDPVAVQDYDFSTGWPKIYGE